MKYELLSNFILKNLRLDTKNSDVLEYMVLEKAQVLKSCNKSNIKCVTIGDSSSNLLLEYKTSVLTFGFEEDNPNLLLGISEGIKSSINNSIYDTEAQYYKNFKHQTAHIIPNDILMEIINCSSLTKAQGNIENLSYEELKELKEGVSSYRVDDNDKALLDLISTLEVKINKALSKYEFLDIVSRTADFLTLEPLKTKLKQETNPARKEAASTMIGAMENAIVNYHKDKNTDKFKQDVAQAISTALPVLEQQTGWKKVIDAVVNAVMNFICPKTAEQSQGKSTYHSYFFANPNPVLKEIEDVEQNISNNL